MNPDQIKQLYLSIAELGNSLFEFSDCMKALGFAAFAWRNEFQESFCRTEEERENHRRYLVEIAKKRLAEQAPRSAWWETGSHYRSRYLDELIVQRDEKNGCSGAELRERFPDETWRMEIDPAWERLVRARVKDAEFEARWQSVRDKESETLKSETKAHSTGLSNGFSFDEAGRYNFYSAVMERDATGLGFAADKRKSGLGFPVFSKRVLDDLDICWALEERHLLNFHRTDGDLRPFLEVRRASFRGQAKHTTPPQCLILAYHAAIPDFAQAYGKFRSLEELETVVIAHLALYSLVQPIIEGAVRRAFGSSDSKG